MRFEIKQSVFKMYSTKVRGLLELTIPHREGTAEFVEIKSQGSAAAPKSTGQIPLAPS